MVRRTYVPAGTLTSSSIQTCTYRYQCVHLRRQRVGLVKALLDEDQDNARDAPSHFRPTPHRQSIRDRTSLVEAPGLRAK